MQTSEVVPRGTPPGPVISQHDFATVEEARIYYHSLTKDTRVALEITDDTNKSGKALYIYLLHHHLIVTARSRGLNTEQTILEQSVSRDPDPPGSSSLPSPHDRNPRISAWTQAMDASKTSQGDGSRDNPLVVNHQSSGDSRLRAQVIPLIGEVATRTANVIIQTHLRDVIMRQPWLGQCDQVPSWMLCHIWSANAWVNLFLVELCGQAGLTAISSLLTELAESKTPFVAGPVVASPTSSLDKEGQEIEAQFLRLMRDLTSLRSSQPSPAVSRFYERHIHYNLSRRYLFLQAQFQTQSTYRQEVLDATQTTMAQHPLDRLAQHYAALTDTNMEDFKFIVQPNRIVTSLVERYGSGIIAVLPANIDTFSTPSRSMALNTIIECIDEVLPELEEWFQKVQDRIVLPILHQHYNTIRQLAQSRVCMTPGGIAMTRRLLAYPDWQVIMPSEIQVQGAPSHYMYDI